MSSPVANAKPVVVAGPPPRPSRLAAFWANAIGKKALMAVTGIVLFVFVLVHMAANLQAFQGPAKLDRYAELLHVSPGLLWTARIVLLVAVGVHALAGIQLWTMRRTARPHDYAELRPTASTPASRTMIWSGFLILGFVVYHLLDLTFGVANRAYTPGIKTFAVAFAVILGIGFAAIPLAVLFGVIGG